MARRSKSGIIDVHHHGLPPFWKALLDDCDIHYIAGGTPEPTWTPQVSLKLMDEYGIDAAMLMVSGYGGYSTTVARKNNEYWAKVIQDYPGKFGAYALLNFPDQDGALKEVEYSIDTLKLDGVGVLSNIQGHYLSDPEYGELLSELNRRKTVVAFHANVPPGTRGIHQPPAFSIELGLDVLRLVGKLTRGDIFDRYPDIRWLIPFNGTAIPVLAGEFTLGEKAKMAALRRQYYTVMAPTRAIMEFFQPTRIMWGSDFLIGDVRSKTAMVVKALRDLHEYDGFDKKTLTMAMVERGNAIAMFPRWKKYFKE